MEFVTTHRRWSEFGRFAAGDKSEDFVMIGSGDDLTDRTGIRLQKWAASV
jgi:hypothetical protein